ncbi:MAG: aspartate-semialdehyde dehydrogenase, partial [Firmicutes bacterium]|nr:aspartate-semialdehyde dehydrogenase [Bacillota bacterium]
MNIAVVGASGLVGKKVIQVLGERKVNYKNLYRFASSTRVADGISYEKLCMQNIENKKIDVVIFCASDGSSVEFAKVFIDRGAYVIDNSSAFRQTDGVPLVV